ncbi:Ovochymase-1 [Myotis davidii]|uniref:Ovochymase-1 n=1 Tax=Myotis davidii TaxID=225400 RepID=L5LI95_MYODS|nr:Ovochymase-1 [Myotis davidii]
MGTMPELAELGVLPFLAVGLPSNPGIAVQPICLPHGDDKKNNPLFWTVVAGDHDRTVKELTKQVRKAKRIVVHGDFNGRTLDSDIALMQLSSPLEFSSVVRPVCLPHGTEPLFSSEVWTVTG